MGADRAQVAKIRLMRPRFAVDHLAHLLLFQILKPLLLKSSTPDFNSRVVMISSEAHAFSTVQLGNYDLRRPASDPYIPLVDLEDGDHRNPIILYAQAKTANIWMANEIERRYGGSGVHGLSLHPGKIITAGWANLVSCSHIGKQVFGPLGAAVFLVAVSASK